MFSGVSGRPGPRRFNGLTGVGVDAHGNVYVASSGHGPRYDAPGETFGASLESYAPDGHQRWRRPPYEFAVVAMAGPQRIVLLRHPTGSLDPARRFIRSGDADPRSLRSGCQSTTATAC
jgi:hypothetical protein